jgi:hypothetical protein
VDVAVATNLDLPLSLLLVFSDSMLTCETISPPQGVLSLQFAQSSMPMIAEMCIIPSTHFHFMQN